MAESERGRRIPVSRPRAVAAAVELADVEGLDAVSMRSLAARLNVVPMALYKHVTSKEDLVDAMVDSLIAQYSPAPPDQPWKEQLRARILSARRVLATHRWARQAIETRTTRTPQVLGYLDSLAGIFLAAGFSADLTHHAMHALGHRVWGFNPEAFADADEPAIPDDPAAQQAVLNGLAVMRAAYPNIAAITLDAVDGDVLAIPARCDEEFEFAFTLDLLLDAFERLHEAGWSSRIRPAPNVS